MGNIKRDIAQREQRESSHERVSSFLSAAIEKWWVYIPARMDRYSSLLSNALTDGIYLAAWPRVAMLLPFLALILGVVEGVGHFKLLSIWDVGMSYGPAYVFAQSLPLVIAAAFVGTLSANAGLMLVLGYALGDYIWAGAPLLYRYNAFVPTFIHVRIPQLFTYVLFFALAVMPILSTNYLLAGLNRRISAKGPGSTAARIGVTALVQSLFLYEWTFIAPMSFHSLWS